jgi:hypothetical protein
MSELTMHCDGREPKLLSNRLAAFLRPHGGAKALARAIGCDPRTAESILTGTWPQAKHWLGIWHAFGDDVLDAVFRPNDAAERLAREIHDLEQQLAEARAAHRTMAGFTPGVAAHENGSAR